LNYASVFGVFTEFGGKFLPSLAKIIVKISVIVSQKHKKNTFTDIQLLTNTFKAFGGKLL
jgi:hypothetical protein